MDVQHTPDLEPNKSPMIIVWILIFVLLAIISACFLFGCAAVTPEMQTMINNHTKAVDYYVDETLPGRSDLFKLAEAIKKSNRILEEFANDRHGK
jgi:hypothetical protein